MLPIAKEVNKIIIETYEYLETLPNKKAKDAHMKVVEESIKREYTPRMKKLSYSQGKLLIKLIYRESNSFFLRIEYRLSSDLCVRDSIKPLLGCSEQASKRSMILTEWIA